MERFSFYWMSFVQLGNTPLHIACREDNAHVCRTLLRCGAEFNSRNNVSDSRMLFTAGAINLRTKVYMWCAQANESPLLLTVRRNHSAILDVVNEFNCSLIVLSLYVLSGFHEAIANYKAFWPRLQIYSVLRTATNKGFLQNVAIEKLLEIAEDIHPECMPKFVMPLIAEASRRGYAEFYIIEKLLKKVDYCPMVRRPNCSTCKQPV